MIAVPSPADYERMRARAREAAVELVSAVAARAEEEAARVRADTVRASVFRAEAEQHRVRAIARYREPAGVLRRRLHDATSEHHPQFRRRSA